MIDSYQKAFLQMLKEYFNEIIKDYRELLNKAHITFSDVAAISYIESSFSRDSKLCTLGNGNPFQIYEGAYLDAVRKSAEKGIDIRDITQSYIAYKTPICKEYNGKLSIDLDFHRNHLKGALKMLLSYLWVLWENYNKRLPKINIPEIEKLLITYFVGIGCTQNIKSIETMDEDVSECLGKEIYPSLYIERYKEGKALVRDFFT